MRITIPTTGSRGDVQPYVALGAALQAHGHEVRVATHADFESFVREHGLDFFALEEGGQALQASEIGDRMVHAGDNPFTFLREFTRLRRPLVRDLLQRIWEACRGADAILATNTEFLLAEAVAEKERLPNIWTCLQPVAPSRYRESCLFPAWPKGLLGSSLYNLSTHAITGWGMWLLLRRSINAARREILDLPPVPLHGPVSSFLGPRFCLDGYSSHVVPPPPDWNAKRHVTGYWFVAPNENEALSPEMEDFLAAGSPPICIGFGSMHNRDSNHVTDLVVEALELAGQRAILLTGWGGMKESKFSDRLFPAKAAPHSLLFPKTAAIVHHGGAGTTAASLRAGVPMLAVPYMADQTFWGRRVASLGAGPSPISHKKLTAPSLAKAIKRMIEDGEMRRRAADLGEKIRKEDGANFAADLLDRNFLAGVRHLPRVRLRDVIKSVFTGKSHSRRPTTMESVKA